MYIYSLFKFQTQNSVLMAMARHRKSGKFGPSNKQICYSNT